MKRMLALVALCAAMVSHAFAQTTQITASHIQVFGGQAVTGSFCATPTDSNGNAINLVTTTGQLFSPATAKCFPISAGVLSSTAIVPDTSTTQPANACYLTTIKDNFGNTLATYPCLQPQGTTWSFDAYVPTSTPSIPALSLPQYQVNGVPLSLQSVINFSGPGVSRGTGGNVVISGGGSGNIYSFSPIIMRPGKPIVMVPNQPIVME